MVSVGARFALALGLAVASLWGCAPHYRAYVEVSPASRRSSDERSVEAFRPEDVEMVDEVVSRIAREWDMKTRPRPEGMSPEAYGREGWTVLAKYGGPYGGARIEEREHPAYLFQISAWLRHDRRVVELWLTDWESVGVSERLKALRDEVVTALEEEIPKGTVRVEIREIGWIAP